MLRGRPDGRGRRRRYPAQESLIVRRRSGARRLVRGARESRFVAAPLERVRASRRRPGPSSAEPPSWSSPPQRCYGSTRGLIRGNLANGGLIWDASCEWTPAGGFLRPCGLCGFDTPKRCQGLTRPKSLGGRRALACAGFSRASRAGRRNLRNVRPASPPRDHGRGRNVVLGALADPPLPSPALHGAPIC